MITAQIILYISVLSLFFLSKRIKKLFGLDKRCIKLKNEYPFDKENNNCIASKPVWKLKAHTMLLYFLFVFIFIGLSLVITYLWCFLRRYFIFTNPEAIYLGFEGGITWLPVIFMAIPLSNLILESIPLRTARYANNRYSAITLPRKLDIFLTKWLFIIFFAIGFPFIILNTDYYIAVNNNYINVHRYFSFTELSYSISSDIEYTDVTYTSGDDFYYTVHTFDGNKIKLKFIFPEKERNIELSEIFLNNDIEIIDRYRQANTDST